MKSDLQKIKEKYGEKMAHFCRTAFPSLLETEDLLYNLIISRFYPSKFLYDDILSQRLEPNFKEYIYSLIKLEEEKAAREKTEKTPSELLEEVGYILYECKTEQDIQKFKKYYSNGEELCTFRGGRLNSCFVFFAVKKNVDSIIRENFSNPAREDEYGTSVISIQFSRATPNSLSIKNRYNHTVVNCDNTFYNNLENITPGLKASFEDSYGLNIREGSNDDFEIKNYTIGDDGKFYKYNYEINNIYYCPNNIIIDNGQVKREYQQSERYIVLDYFILDMKEKTIKPYDSEVKDSFCGFGQIDKITIKKEKDRKHICIEKDGKTAIITIDNENKIISYHNNNIEQIGSYFLYYNQSLETLYLEGVKKIGDQFLSQNQKLKLIVAPSLEEVGNFFLYFNSFLDSIWLPYLKKAGNFFIGTNIRIQEIYLPRLESVGKNFLEKNQGLTSIELPCLIKAEDHFIRNNRLIKDVYMPYLEEVGAAFLFLNNSLKTLVLPNLKEFGMGFLRYNETLISIELPKIQSIGKYYLEVNRVLEKVVMPEEERNRFIYNGRSFVSNFTKQKKLNRWDKNQLSSRRHALHSS